MATHNLPLPTSKAGCTLIGCAQGSTRKLCLPCSYHHGIGVHETRDCSFHRKAGDLTDGALCYLRCAAGLRSCAALWSGCCFGRGGSRDGSCSALLPFTAPLHLVLLRRDSHHCLVCRNGTGAVRSLARLLCEELFLDSRHRRHSAPESYLVVYGMFGIFVSWFSSRVGVQNDCSPGRATIWRSASCSGQPNSRR